MGVLSTAALYLDSSLKCEQVGTGDSPRRLGSVRQSVPGVGPIVSYTLLGELPELGTLSHACARKLLTILNAMLRDQSRWTSNVQYSC